MFEFLELIELLPEILEIGSATRKYRENEADARLRFETFAYGTLAQHRARLAIQKPQSETGRSEEPS